MSGKSIKAGIVGATGYAGAELVRLLARHPNVELALLTSHSQAGKPAYGPAPQLRGLDLPLLETFDAPSAAERCDVVFLAQESGFAIHHARPLLNAGAKVIDLSADFRLSDPTAYPQWYKLEHSEPSLLKEALYGLPELTPIELYCRTHLIANPGCYPTGAALALAPIVQEGLSEGVIVVDSKSGVSGAGRSKTTVDYLFSELNDSFKAYNPVQHRHVPEIGQTLQRLKGEAVKLRFTPHLIPATRGIFTTAHVPLKSASSQETLQSLYESFYQNKPFVHVLEAGQIPATKHVAASNACHLSVVYDPINQYAVCFSVIDNLGKGAAGQAIQNMNLLFDLDETAGLDIAGVYP